MTAKAKKKSSRGRKQDRARLPTGRIWGPKMARTGGLTEFGRRARLPAPGSGVLRTTPNR